MTAMNNVDPLFVLSNQIEAALWTLIAVGMAVATLRRSSTRRECAIGAVAFALFGVSDLVETTTGAWWRPWWLFAWKGACVLGVILAIASARYRARS